MLAQQPMFSRFSRLALGLSVSSTSTEP